MKLKNKLVPFTCIAAATSVVVPLTVSCGNSTIAVDDINSVERAMPTFEQHDVEPQFLEFDESKETEAQFATREYVSFVKKNPQAFVDDLRWGTYQNWLSFYDNSDFTLWEVGSPVLKFDSQIKSLKFGATTPTFSTVNVVKPGQGPDQKNEYDTVSFKMRVEVEADVTTLHSRGGNIYKSVKTIKLASDVEYKNMIFYAFPASRDNKINLSRYAWLGMYGNKTTPEKMNVDLVNTDNPGWFITISDLTGEQEAYRYNLEDWAINCNAHLEIDQITTVNSSEETHTNTKANYNETIDKIDELNDWVNAKSYADEGSHYNYPNFWDWFDQTPQQLLANSALMDTMSYYFANTYNNPAVLKRDKALGLDTASLAIEEDDEGPLYPVDENGYFIGNPNMWPSTSPERRTEWEDKYSTSWFYAPITLDGWVITKTLGNENYYINYFIDPEPNPDGEHEEITRNPINLVIPYGYGTLNMLNDEDSVYNYAYNHLDSEKVQKVIDEFGILIFTPTRKIHFGGTPTDEGFAIPLSSSEHMFDPDMGLLTPENLPNLTLGYGYTDKVGHYGITEDVILDSPMFNGDTVDWAMNDLNTLLEKTTLTDEDWDKVVDDIRYCDVFADLTPGAQSKNAPFEAREGQDADGESYRYLYFKLPYGTKISIDYVIIDPDVPGKLDFETKYIPVPDLNLEIRFGGDEKKLSPDEA